MAREGYLLHAGEDRIHDPKAEKKADTPRKKWDNFWYYHKKHVILGVLAAAAAVFFIRDSMGRVQPDYTVGMATQTFYPDEAAEALEKAMEPFGKDLNGDGRVVVQISPYVLPAEGSASSGIADPRAAAAGRMKFVADVSAGESAIFITDDATFRQVEAQTGLFAYLDGGTPKKGARDYGRMRALIAQCPKLAGAEGLPRGLSLSLRVFSGPAAEGDRAKDYAAAKELFQKLTAGSPAGS